MATAKKSNAGRLVQDRTTVMELERPSDMPNETESEGLLAEDASPEPTNASGAPAEPRLMAGGLDPRELAHKRWGVDWHNIPVSDGNVLLGDLKEEFERAAKIMQQRQKAALTVECACGCGLRLGEDVSELIALATKLPMFRGLPQELHGLVALRTGRRALGDVVLRDKTALWLHRIPAGGVICPSAIAFITRPP